MIALIDADILVYRCGFAAEKKDWLLTYEDSSGELVNMQFNSKTELNAYVKAEGIEDFVTDHRVVAEPVNHALQNVHTVLDTIRRELQPKKMVLFMSGKTNFRDEIATIRPYKGNRDELHKPVHYDAIRDYLASQKNIRISDNEEADDLIGIEAMKLRAEGVPCVIVSTDKDLDMIPGAHYNWVQKEGYDVSETEAIHNFYVQLMSGDSTDNIQGIPGIGPAKARRALSDYMGRAEQDYYATVWDAYRDSLPEASDDRVDEVLLETGRLIWIRRNPGENWTPPL